MNWTDIHHFVSSEFDSPDEPGSGLTKMNLEFVKRLDDLRTKCGFAFVIDSGYRTEAHNATLVDSVQGSAHTLGLAVDIACRSSVQRIILIREALAAGFVRVGVGKTFIHLDADKTKPQDVAWVY